MELIKKIKQAETQAQEIIEQAKTQAAKQTEKSRDSRLKSLAQAELKRKKAIEAAAAKAEVEGLAEIEILKAQGKKNRQQLRSSVDGKMAGAVAKVTDYMGSHFAKSPQTEATLRG